MLLGTTDLNPYEGLQNARRHGGQRRPGGWATYRWRCAVAADGSGGMTSAGGGRSEVDFISSMSLTLLVTTLCAARRALGAAEGACGLGGERQVVFLANVIEQLIFLLSSSAIECTTQRYRPRSTGKFSLLTRQELPAISAKRLCVLHLILHVSTAAALS